MSYPDWWDTEITVYNKYEDPLTNIIIWYKTYIEGTFWKYIGNTVVINNITLETDNSLCRIRKDERFKPKYEWINLPNDIMPTYFTLGKGDIVVKGHIDEDIDEYVAGQRSTDFLAKYADLGECMVIKEVALNDYDSRGLMHYLIKGV